MARGAQRTRYFFNGLTEEIAKVSVPGAHSDSAFEFVTEEEGTSASEWYHSVSGSGISVSSVSDTARRSNVIKCQNDSEAKPVFRIGEKDGTSENPNDSAWNSTKRVVSFWMKGECASMNVQVSASTGAKYVQYLFGTGTNGALSGGNARVYLGYAAPEDWVRFERNVEADFEAYAGGGATWTNTDGLYIHWPKELLSYAFYVDDLRLSDSLTVEHNTLGPGVIGHILRHTTWDAGTLARTDRWFHYDQVGSVLNESDEAGDDVTRHEQDAFGNVMEGWQSGLWMAHNTIDGHRWGHMRFDKDSGLWLGSQVDSQNAIEPDGISLTDRERPSSYSYEATKCDSCANDRGVVDAAFEALSRRMNDGSIRPGPLKECIDRQLTGNHGLKIKCANCADPDFYTSVRPGADPMGAIAVVLADGWAVEHGTIETPTNSIYLCMNYVRNRNAGTNGDTIIHEAAHTCGWRHEFDNEFYPEYPGPEQGPSPTGIPR